MIVRVSSATIYDVVGAVLYETQRRDAEQSTCTEVVDLSNGPGRGYGISRLEELEDGLIQEPTTIM